MGKHGPSVLVARFIQILDVALPFFDQRPSALPIPFAIRGRASSDCSRGAVHHARLEGVLSDAASWACFLLWVWRKRVQHVVARFELKVSSIDETRFRFIDSSVQLQSLFLYA